MPDLDFTDRIAVEDFYPLGTWVRFNDTSGSIRQVIGYRMSGRDWILLVTSGNGSLGWHPGNVTRVRRVNSWVRY